MIPTCEAASSLPVGDKAVLECQLASGAFQQRASRPVARSQRWTAPSPPAEASRLAPGAKASE